MLLLGAWSDFKDDLLGTDIVSRVEVGVRRYDFDSFQSLSFT